MAISVVKKPALQIFANARMCFIPYWVNAPQFASYMRTCMSQNQVLETMMRLPIQEQKKMVFLKMITIPFEISTQFLREQKTLRSD